MNWISVRERQPEERGFYLVWEPEVTTIPQIVWYYGKGNAWGWDGGKVTHWMPLPEPPEPEPEPEPEPKPKRSEIIDLVELANFFPDEFDFLLGLSDD